jgi:hypothetical protein
MGIGGALPRRQLSCKVGQCRVLGAGASVASLDLEQLIKTKVNILTMQWLRGLRRILSKQDQVSNQKTLNEFLVLSQADTASRPTSTQKDLDT